MALYLTGDAYYALGRYKDAKRMFQKTLEVNFGFTTAQMALKKVQEKLKEQPGG